MPDSAALPPTPPADPPQAAAFRRQVLRPARLRLFMLRKLPMAWLAGLRLVALTPEAATVTIRYKYLTQNLFRSIYWFFDKFREFKWKRLKFAFSYS